jgi:hypothetical protein
VFEEVWLIVDDLDTQAFASSATDQNGVELAALYTLQHQKMQPVDVLPSANDRKALAFERMTRSCDYDGFG